jgi:hypothetical protein
VFGSLFTLCTPLVLLLRQPRRLLWVFAAAYLGIALWFWIHQFDRYLQVLVPWMVAGTAVVIGVAWRKGGWLRAAIAGLVGLQIVWGADVMFIPSHHAAGGALPKVLADLFASANSSGDRFVVDAVWEEMGKALPPHAKVLVHEEVVHLGLHAESVLDCPGDQGLLYWGEPGATSPAEIWRQLHGRGVTHLVWASRTSHGSDTVAGALTFFELATRHARPVGSYGGLTLAALDEEPPPATPAGLVAYYPCPIDGTFKPGLYPLAALARSAGDLRSRSDPIAVPAISEAIERARYLLFDARCHGRLPDDARVHFELLAARGQAMLLLRRRSP